AVGSAPHGIAAGDFNGDGKIDLVTANNASLSILLGDGAGGFSNATGSPISMPTNAFAVAVGDLDRDGKLDLAVANNSLSGKLTILRGNGNGTFTVKATYPTNV